MSHDGTHLLAQESAEPRHEITAEQKHDLYKKFGMYEAGQTIGVLNLVATLFVVFRFPEHFWILHSVKAFIWIPWRFVRFRRRGWEWYLLDFCYFNTYFTVTCCLLCFLRTAYGIDNPLHAYAEDLFRVGFAFACGPLLWAVFLFGNKIVFHDVDNTCSFYIHYSPNIFFWTIRWGGGFGSKMMEDHWPDLFTVCSEYEYFDLSNWQDMLWTSGCPASVRQFLFNPSVVWLLMWGIPYYFLVLCLLSGWLARTDKETLYKTTIEDTRGQGRLILKLPQALWKPAYMAQHFLFTVLTGFLSIVMWHSFAVHTAILGFVLLLAIHNGSTFMFRVVAAKRIHQKIAEKEDENIRTPLMSNVHEVGPNAEQVRHLQEELRSQVTQAKLMPEQIQQVLNDLSMLKSHIESR